MEAGEGVKGGMDGAIAVKLWMDMEGECVRA
jgi:hypothetical protein